MCVFASSCYLVRCSYFLFATVVVIVDVTAAAAAKLQNKSIDYSITESLAFYTKQNGRSRARWHSRTNTHSFARLVNAKACKFTAMCLAMQIFAVHNEKWKECMERDVCVDVSERTLMEKCMTTMKLSASASCIIMNIGCEIYRSIVRILFNVGTIKSRCLYACMHTVFFAM